MHAFLELKGHFRQGPKEQGRMKSNISIGEEL
jgi:hypothetical protein